MEFLFEVLKEIIFMTVSTFLIVGGTFILVKILKVFFKNNVITEKIPVRIMGVLLICLVLFYGFAYVYYFWVKFTVYGIRIAPWIMAHFLMSILSKVVGFIMFNTLVQFQKKSKIPDSSLSMLLIVPCWILQGYNVIPILSIIGTIFKN